MEPVAVHAATGSRKREISAERLLRSRSTFAKSVTVSVCRLLEVLNSYSSSRVQKLITHIAATSYSVRTFCLCHPSVP